MKVLGIDTATPMMSVALVDDGRVLGERQAMVEKNRTGVLVLIDALLADAGLRPLDIDAVAIGAGPGSFTGLRIGMATAKGIAFAADRPLWAVSSLAAVADDELARHPTSLVVAVLDARRGEIYAGAYRRLLSPDRPPSLAPAGDERVLPPSELAAFVAAARNRPDEHVRFTGDAAAAHPELAALEAAWGCTPTGAAVARIALVGSRVDILVGGAPTYIRPSEAEVKYPDGVPGALRRRDGER
jgi:tRNA threonylcarbamoyladenosine biosynthesis protein TsaB